jgi:N-acetylglutamate synthase-like GNAT family acetyltransferase
VIGGLVAERWGDAAMLHGPVVATEDTGAPARDHLEIAAQLVGAALDHARALGVRTVYARPQGLDRIWVRFGFIPLPESTLPPGLTGRPGAGLFAWRGGSALWTLRETS